MSQMANLVNLPHDAWFLIFQDFSFSHIGVLRLVSKKWKKHIHLLDEVVKAWYANCILEDVEFWKRAEKRNEYDSRPLPTYFQEIARIEAIQTVAGKRMCAKDFYALWIHMDKHSILAKV